MGVQLLPWGGELEAGVDKSRVVAFIPHPRKERLELKVVRSKDIKRLYSSPLRLRLNSCLSSTCRILCPDKVSCTLRKKFSY